MKKISVLIPCFNETDNIIPMSEAVVNEFNAHLPEYDYELVFIDNDSTDGTRQKLEQICAGNQKIKAIFNAKNFGQFNSPLYGICQTTGDCTISMCCDFQDPVELIPRLVHEWEKGYKIVAAIKTASEENRLLRFLRSCYYKIIKKCLLWNRLSILLELDYMIKVLLIYFANWMIRCHSCVALLPSLDLSGKISPIHRLNDAPVVHIIIGILCMMRLCLVLLLIRK